MTPTTALRGSQTSSVEQRVFAVALRDIFKDEHFIAEVLPRRNLYHNIAMLSSSDSEASLWYALMRA